jgi:hypothetical protein
MRQAPVVALALACAACSALLGIQDVEEKDPSTEADAATAQPDAPLATPDARVDAPPPPDAPVVAPPDARPDAPVDAAPDAPADAAAADARPDAGGIVVSGTAINEHVTNLGPESAPRDLSDSIIEVGVLSGSTFTRHPGAGTRSGVFSVPAVPMTGTRYVRIDDVYLVTAATSGLDFGDYLMGRPDKERAPDGTALRVEITNAEIVAEGDVFEVWSSNHDLVTPVEEPVGANTFMEVFQAPFRFDGSGDDLVVNQLTVRDETNVRRHLALSRAHFYSQVETVDGQTITLPQGQFFTNGPIFTNINWRIGLFAAITQTVHPSATYSGSDLRMLGIWGRPAIDLRRANHPRLFHATSTAAADIDYGALRYENAFSQFVQQWSSHVTSYLVGYTAPGATNATGVLGFVTASAPRTDTMVVAPAITPARTPRINNLDAYADRMGVGLAPLLSWASPLTGPAHGYAVEVYRLANDGGDTSFSYVATIFTTATSLRIPPGVLESGAAYFAVLVAIQAPEADLAHGPFKRGMPESRAELFTGRFTP